MEKKLACKIVFTVATTSLISAVIFSMLGVYDFYSIRDIAGAMEDTKLFLQYGYKTIDEWLFWSRIYGIFKLVVAFISLSVFAYLFRKHRACFSSSANW